MIANAAPGQNSLWGKNLDVLPFWLYDLSIHTSMSVFELWNGKGLPSVQHHRVVFLLKLVTRRIPPYYHTTERQNKSDDGLFVNKVTTLQVSPQNKITKTVKLSLWSEVTQIFDNVHSRKKTAILWFIQGVFLTRPPLKMSPDWPP